MERKSWLLLVVIAKSNIPLLAQTQQQKFWNCQTLKKAGLWVRINVQAFFILIVPSSNSISGPDLPFEVYSSSMVISPTGKGVVLIGGSVKYQSVNDLSMNDLPMPSEGLIELTENSTGELQWIPLKQKLKHARKCHLTLEISKDALANIMDKNL